MSGRPIPPDLAHLPPRLIGLMEALRDARSQVEQLKIGLSDWRARVRELEESVAAERKHHGLPPEPPEPEPE